jgi:hypothetical protein
MALPFLLAAAQDPVVAMVLETASARVAGLVRV